MLMVATLGFGQVASQSIPSGVPSGSAVSSQFSVGKNGVSLPSNSTSSITKTQSGPAAVKASTSFHSGTATSFIQNVGQYGTTMKGYEPMGNIQFGYEGLEMPVLFTPKGLIHLHRKYERISHAEEEKLEKQGVPEEEIERRLIITDRVITMEWVGANPNVEIISEEKSTDYHTYGLLRDKAYGYKKITYKNMYPGIDVVYSFTNTNKLGCETGLFAFIGTLCGAGGYQSLEILQSSHRIQQDFLLG